MTDNSNKRRYFRLAYPSSMMPSITIGKNQYPVPEISEAGIRIRGKNGSDVAPQGSRAKPQRPKVPVQVGASLGRLDETTTHDDVANEITDRSGDFAIGHEIRGTIELISGESVAVRGTVYRRDKLEYVIAPLEGLSFKHVVNEQRILLKRFPGLRY